MNTADQAGRRWLSIMALLSCFVHGGFWFLLVASEVVASWSTGHAVGITFALPVFFAAIVFALAHHRAVSWGTMPWPWPWLDPAAWWWGELAHSVSSPYTVPKWPIRLRALTFQNT